MNRGIIEFKDLYGDGLQIVSGSELVNVSCYCEWCGDTETGFGAEVSKTLNKHEVKELINFLTEWVNNHE